VRMSKLRKIKPLIHPAIPGDYACKPQGTEHHMVAVSDVSTWCVGALQASATIQEFWIEHTSHADTGVVGDDILTLNTQNFDRHVRVFVFDGTKLTYA